MVTLYQPSRDESVSVDVSVGVGVSVAVGVAVSVVVGVSVGVVVGVGVSVVVSVGVGVAVVVGVGVDVGVSVAVSIRVKVAVLVEDGVADAVDDGDPEDDSVSSATTVDASVAAVAVLFAVGTAVEELSGASVRRLQPANNIETITKTTSVER